MAKKNRMDPKSEFLKSKKAPGSILYWKILPDVETGGPERTR